MGIYCKYLSIYSKYFEILFSILQQIIDSSKQRSKLRSKNANEKKKLEDLVQECNFINNLLEESENNLAYAEALEGSFPWISDKDKGNVVKHTRNLSTWPKTLILILTYYIDALPLRAKRKAVEAYLTSKRLEEELSLLKSEMVQFLCYYKDNVIPDLSAHLNSVDKGTVQ